MFLLVKLQFQGKSSANDLTSELERVIGMAFDIFNEQGSILTRMIDG